MSGTDLAALRRNAEAAQWLPPHQAIPLLDELEELRAQPVAWQPIESAPKVKDAPLLLTNGVSVSHGWWIDEPGYIREKRDMDGHYIDQDESDGYTGWMDCDGGMQPEPTHWQPLPAAPGSAPPAPSSAGLIEAARKGMEALEAIEAKAHGYGGPLAHWTTDTARAAIAALRAALGKEEAK